MQSAIYSWLRLTMNIPTSKQRVTAISTELSPSHSIIGAVLGDVGVSPVMLLFVSLTIPIDMLTLSSPSLQVLSLCTAVPTIKATTGNVPVECNYSQLT